jgi:hypothetical protein
MASLANTVLIFLLSTDHYTSTVMDVVCIPLNYWSCLTETLTEFCWVNPAEAMIDEKPQFAVARLALQQFQHLLRVGASQPFRLGHGLVSACT